MPDQQPAKFCTIREQFVELCGGDTVSAALLDVLVSFQSWVDKQDGRERMRKSLRGLADNLLGLASKDTISRRLDRMRDRGWLQRFESDEPNLAPEWKVDTDKIGDELNELGYSLPHYTKSTPASQIDRGVSPRDRGVSQCDRGVSHGETDHGDNNTDTHVHDRVPRGSGGEPEANGAGAQERRTTNNHLPSTIQSTYDEVLGEQIDDLRAHNMAKQIYGEVPEAEDEWIAKYMRQKLLSLSLDEDDYTNRGYWGMVCDDVAERYEQSGGDGDSETERETWAEKAGYD